MRKMAVLCLLSVLATGSSVPSSAEIGKGQGVHSRRQAARLVEYEVLIVTAPKPLSDSAGYGAGAGQLAGSGRLPLWPYPDEIHAVYWPAGSSTGIDLHPFEIGDSAALDTSGQQQVGYANGPPTGFAPHAWLWNGDATGSVDLHPAGFWGDSIARATAGGQQVGNINFSNEKNPPVIIVHAALWSGSAESVVDLHPAIAGCDRSYGEDTDGVHQVGFCYCSTAENPYHRALLWQGSAASAVNLHPAEFTQSFAEGVAGDEQVGYAFGGDGYTRALLWHGSAESVISLHSDGFLATSAYATNGIEQVGFGETATFPSTAHALRWSGTAESVFDLHSLLPEDFSEGNSVAYDIDAEGNIAGAAQRLDGSTVAVLWRALVPPEPTPTPTPSPTPTPTPVPGTPVVSRVAPTSGPAAGGTIVTLSGTNFESGAVVTFGSLPCSDVAFGGSEKLSASSPALSAGRLYDVTVVNPGGGSGYVPLGWFADFEDVPQSNLFHDDVESLFRSAVSAGCGGGNFCPTAAVTRAQMAVFLLKGMYGALYEPPPATGMLFADVPANAFAADWIEKLLAEGITGGCGSGNFCPNAVVTRAQMAVMLLKARHGTHYAPPSCTGVFVDVPCGPAPAFAVDWIEQLAAEGITAGCGGGAYCPDNATLRGSMATFLVKTFSLQTPQD